MTEFTLPNHPLEFDQKKLGLPKHLETLNIWSCCESVLDVNYLPKLLAAKFGQGSKET